MLFVLAVLVSQIVWWYSQNAVLSLFLMIAIISLRYPLGWIVAIPLGLVSLSRWYQLKSRPWRRIHFPLMRLHASLAGSEQISSESESRNWSIDNVLRQMVSSCFPDWSHLEVEMFIEEELAKMRVLHDERALKSFMITKYPKTTDEDFRSLLKNAKQKINFDDNGVKTRAVIAGIIERKIGLEHKAEYLYALFTGKAF